MSSPCASPRWRTGNHSTVEDTTELAMQPPATPCRNRNTIMPAYADPAAGKSRPSTTLAAMPPTTVRRAPKRFSSLPPMPLASA